MDKIGHNAGVMKLGIFGGSFNPVHNGHLLLAQDALEAFGLDRVLFVPCAQAPHKPASLLASAEDRRAMLELALARDPRFEVCGLEMERGGVSYSLDTVTALIRQFPEARPHFIIGSDTLRELSSWKSIDRLLELCEFVTMARPGFDGAGLTDAEIGLPAPWPDRLRAKTATGHVSGISSSEIRRRLARGFGIRYFVPPEVETYIRERKVYVERN